MDWAAKRSALISIASIWVVCQFMGITDAQERPIDRSLLTECSHGHFKKAADLIKQGANANAKDERGESPLHLVHLPLARPDPDGYLAIIQLLIANGANVNAHSASGATPLHQAVSERSSAAIEILLQAGGDPNSADNNGRTPLHLASELECVKLLVNAGAKLDIADREGFTPVRRVGCSRNQIIYEWLLAANGGKEPSIVVPFAPNPEFAAKSTTELIATLSRERPELFYPFHLELISRGKNALPEIQKGIEQGKPIEYFLSYFGLWGPDVAAALPTLVSQLVNKQQGHYALMAMDMIRPGTFAGLPEATKRRAAESLYEAVVEAEDVLAGQCINALCDIGEPATPVLLRLLHNPRSHVRWVTLKQLQYANFSDQSLATEFLNLSRADADHTIRDAAMVTFGRFCKPDDATKSSLIAFMKEDSSVANTAAYVLGSRFGSIAIDDLLPLLAQTNSVQRNTAIAALRHMGVEAIPRLTVLANAPNQSVATAAKIGIDEIKSWTSILKN